MRSVIFAAVLCLLSANTAAYAQYGRNDNPNMRNFYMARQQVQITDDTPQVNDMRTFPQPGQAAAPAVSGPQPLPRAGFSTYMSGYQGGGGKNALPQVNNGVPKQLPQTITGLPQGQKAPSAGKLKPKAPSVAAPAVAKTYKPYATVPAAQSGGNSGSMFNSSTSVQGSVLHWNKRRSGY